MSVNLYCEATVGNRQVQVDLAETPTWVTRMCLSVNPQSGEPDGGQEGVRRRYIIWLRSQLDGVWMDDEDHERHKEMVGEQIHEAETLVNPRFYER